ncbi:hypothetical protein CLV28_1551 [Sediminihabitans luteus]|uniref:Uncharacterized protein n=1 Tax=Sediminihabitans luteus TaxID=1138585 RepID=A0A2M9CQ58_9CELL|nr:hypothetical protein [Sediminihabitans luteus]PJJ74062.1 hypothetical protein CLV28_1551 [Sediminihabitans luteus]
MISPAPPSRGATSDVRAPRRAARARTGALTVAALVALALGGCSQDAPTEDRAGASTSPAPGVVDLPTFGPTSSVGGLAPDFPGETVPAPPDATVLASAATPGGTTTAFSLSLSVPGAAADVLAFYDDTFDGAGFDTASPEPAQGTAGQRLYTRTTNPSSADRTDEAVTLVVIETDGSCLVSLSGDVVP